METQKLSRRDFPVRLASLAAGLGITWRSTVPARALEPETRVGLSHDAEAIHQEILFATVRKRLYEALLTAKQFDRVSQLGRAARTVNLANSPTQINRELGGAFVLFDGNIIGRQLELVPNQRIVQAWREVDWDPGIYSVGPGHVRFPPLGYRN